MTSCKAGSTASFERDSHTFALNFSVSGAIFGTKKGTEKAFSDFSAGFRWRVLMFTGGRTIIVWLLGRRSGWEDYLDGNTYPQIGIYHNFLFNKRDPQQRAVGLKVYIF
jgi:hypothetical protein